MTINDYIRQLPISIGDSLPRPPFTPSSTDTKNRPDIGMAVASMQHHTTNEGWELFTGLRYANYILAGYDLPVNSCNTRAILDWMNPKTIVLQDKREWDVEPDGSNFRDSRARFRGVELLQDRPDIFKVTVLKDAHQRPYYHQQSAEEIDCHKWIVYYNPLIVKHLAPYVRINDLIRVYHTVNSSYIPPFNRDRTDTALLSGALGKVVYPIRTALAQQRYSIPSMKYLRHPGYHRNGCHTHNYYNHLNSHKVAICTCSIYGYALRKIIEATACGCMVVTNLPSDEYLPLIDRNLIRIYGYDWKPERLQPLLNKLYQEYCYEKQYEYAQSARHFYDYRVSGLRLAADIDQHRLSYNTAVFQT